LKITPAFIQGEIIGLDVQVVKSTNPSCIGIQGAIINESRNTLTIHHSNEDSIIIKNTSVFHFTTKNGTIIEVDGNIITGRPEDRVKKHLKRRW
jgi:ribonuclease P protein subunit POP4